jgi:hypothetical protein
MGAAKVEFAMYGEGVGVRRAGSVYAAKTENHCVFVTIERPERALPFARPRSCAAAGP